jgi:CheY-like chemotaxis protein
MVVDDTPDNLEMTALLLERAGASVFRASSAAEAFDVLERETVDVLVSDIGMPRADGVDLLHAIRQRHPDHNGFIPALALTAYSEDNVVGRIRDAGFRRHLVKPIRPEELVRVVAEIASAA